MKIFPQKKMVGLRLWACVMHQKKNFKVTFGASPIIVAHWLVGCHFEVANVMIFIYFSVTVQKQFLLYRDVKGSY